VADGEGSTEVWASVADAYGASVELADEDEIVATVGGDAHDLEERGLGEYMAEVSVDHVGARFEVALLRDEAASARRTGVHLPAPFDFTAPAAGASFRTDDDTIAITWDRRARDPMRVALEGSCIDDQRVELSADVGRFLVHPGTLDLFGEGCVVEVRVERVRVGEIDGALRGGRIEARQVRRTEIYVSRGW